MKKDSPIAFRIPSTLKKALQNIATREARSISQICELMLAIGSDAYQKEGQKYLQRYLDRQKEI
jgi:hypothetical protein